MAILLRNPLFFIWKLLKTILVCTGKLQGDYTCFLSPHMESSAINTMSPHAQGSHHQQASLSGPSVTVSIQSLTHDHHPFSGSSWWCMFCGFDQSHTDSCLDPYSITQATSTVHILCVLPVIPPSPKPWDPESCSSLVVLFFRNVTKLELYNTPHWASPFVSVMPLRLPKLFPGLHARFFSVYDAFFLNKREESFEICFPSQKLIFLTLWPAISCWNASSFCFWSSMLRSPSLSLSISLHSVPARAEGKMQAFTRPVQNPCEWSRLVIWQGHTPELKSPNPRCSDTPNLLLLKPVLTWSYVAAKSAGGRLQFFKAFLPLT